MARACSRPALAGGVCPHGARLPYCAGNRVRAGWFVQRAMLGLPGDAGDHPGFGTHLGWTDAHSGSGVSLRPPCTASTSLSLKPVYASSAHLLTWLSCGPVVAARFFPCWTSETQSDLLARRSMKRLILFGLLAGVVPGLCSAQAAPSNPSVPATSVSAADERAAAQEQRIKDLEERLISLEGRPYA